MYMISAQISLILLAVLLFAFILFPKTKRYFVIFGLTVFHYAKSVWQAVRYPPIHESMMARIFVVVLVCGVFALMIRYGFNLGILVGILLVYGAYKQAKAGTLHATGLKLAKDLGQFGRFLFIGLLVCFLILIAGILIYALLAI